ncbi:MAG: hypothetical protein ABSB35_28755, partial [Bryobacteraceae bacterium]
MLRFSFVTLLGLSGSLLHAEFVYQQTTQMTGGSLLATMKMAGPLTRQAREPNISTYLLKGDRMVTLTKERATVIDLSKENITEIDFNKKTYSVMTFAEMKQALENAMQRMQSRQNDNKIDANFSVSAKATGQTKTIQSLEAKELLVTMALEGTDQDTGRSGSMTTEMDNWMAPVPGYEEVKEFHRKMGEKMGYLFASGMAQMSMMRPEMAAGIAQAAKEMAKLDGMPVQSIMKITGAGNGSMPDGQGQQPAAPTASDAASAAAQSQTSRLPGGLGSLASGLGGFGRRKQQQAPPTPSSQQPG